MQIDQLYLHGHPAQLWLIQIHLQGSVLFRNHDLLPVRTIEVELLRRCVSDHRPVT